MTLREEEDSLKLSLLPHNDLVVIPRGSSLSVVVGERQQLDH